uniref:Uncharacterized protein n=1 Tax=viral metagenome TaxID=1070528 RepID=A0A6M3JVW9_9ZZZZ
MSWENEGKGYTMTHERRFILTHLWPEKYLETRDSTRLRLLKGYRRGLLQRKIWSDDHGLDLNKEQLLEYVKELIEKEQ